MWYKVRELQSKGLNKTQTGKYLGVDRSTVRRYLQMSREEFVRKQSAHRKYELKLGKYEEYVRGMLEEYPYISSARMHDWLRECYPDFPVVCDKTVFNFVERVRLKYGIGKKSEARIRRDYEKLPDTPYGSTPRRISVKNGCRHGTAEARRCIFRHRAGTFTLQVCAFQPQALRHGAGGVCARAGIRVFRGQARKIVYDQDRVLIARENLGDLILTRKFQAFVREQHFQPVFCHKADPESKGKVENVVKYVKENFLAARVYHDADTLNGQALLWLERTGNGKVHGTTHLVPSEEFAMEQGYLTPYHGIPKPPQEEMREYHVRKDNTVQYRGITTAFRAEPTAAGRRRSGFRRLTGMWALQQKHGKLVGRHELCTRKGKTVYDEGHRKPRNTGAGKLAERILIYVSGNREVALWMENLKEGRSAITRTIWK